MRNGASPSSSHSYISPFVLVIFYRIHGTGLFTYICLISMVHVGRYALRGSNEFDKEGLKELVFLNTCFCLLGSSLSERMTLEEHHEHSYVCMYRIQKPLPFNKQQHLYIFQKSLVLPSIFHSPVEVPSLSKSHSSGPMSPEVIAIYSAKTKGCGENVWW